MRKVVVLALSFLVAAAGVLSSCGPAPGYGPDGRLLTEERGTGGPGFMHGGRGGPIPGGYVAPNQAPAPYDNSGGYAQPAPNYAPPPGYDEYSSGSEAEVDPSVQAQPIAPDPASEPPPVANCEDSCRFAGNGECDDGRDGSDTDLCAYGTDCSDCGSAPR